MQGRSIDVGTMHDDVLNAVVEVPPAVGTMSSRSFQVSCEGGQDERRGQLHGVGSVGEMNIAAKRLKITSAEAFIPNQNISVSAPRQLPFCSYHEPGLAAVASIASFCAMRHAGEQ